eukprot:7065551-Alexandrium_andersonii.AAC.1
MCIRDSFFISVGTELEAELVSGGLVAGAGCGQVELGAVAGEGAGLVAGGGGEALVVGAGGGPEELGA